MLALSVVLSAAVVGCRVPTARAAANDSTQESIVVEGMTRTYRLHTPPGADGPLPLVFNFHGYGGTGADEETLSGMDSAADTLHFVVVYPNGIDKHWRFGLSEISDVDFVNAVIDHLADSGAVDPSRVYATGLSDGGFFSIYLGCLSATRMAAIAPVAASMTGLQAIGCAVSPHIPVMLTFGTDDPIVSWGGKTSASGKLLSVDATIGVWADHLGVSTDPTRDELLPDRDPNDGSRAHLRVYGDGELQLYAIEGGGHTWPGGEQYLPVWAVGHTNRDYDASEAILDFFSR